MSRFHRKIQTQTVNIESVLYILSYGLFIYMEMWEEKKNFFELLLNMYEYTLLTTTNESKKKK